MQEGQQLCNVMWWTGVDCAPGSVPSTSHINLWKFHSSLGRLSQSPLPGRETEPTRSEVPSLRQGWSLRATQPARVVSTSHRGRITVPKPTSLQGCPGPLCQAALGTLRMEPWRAEGPSGWELCLVSTFPSVGWAGHSIHECGSRVVLDSSSVNLSCGCCDWEPQKTFFISFN